MRLKTKKFFAAVMLMNTLFTLPALATTRLNSGNENTLVNQGVEAITTLLAANPYSVKRGQPYDESNDPAFKSTSGGPEQTTPKHGYFAVPLIVIGLAGVLLYFSKFD